ncbi:MAG: hypothetical protein CBARDMAM_4987 [uncultured Caballeronia sp.]|nr:MAG: hypothetical protein CBARDMAM_4987 [uncultured Caballeronia sp.]
MAKIVTFGKSDRSRLPHYPWSIWKTLTKQGVAAPFQPGAFLASSTGVDSGQEPRKSGDMPLTAERYEASR